MIRIIPLSLNLLGYLMKHSDRDIIMMADDFYYASYPESIKQGKKEKLKSLTNDKKTIFEFCAGEWRSWGRNSILTAENSGAIHAFFVVENERELKERFCVIDVIKG